MVGKMIIFSAPSGAGKTTIVKHLLSKFPQFEFSISATSRKMRDGEQHGKDYFFLSVDDFKRRIANDEFVEWEEVYADNFYGTLKSELERIWAKGNVVIFDVDVKGGVNLKRMFPDNSLSLFVMPPSVEELRNRLVGRGTDSAEAIERRVAKAQEELSYSSKFDVVVVNDNLEDAKSKAEDAIASFLR
ncbi:guanylate kinase [Acetobacteroides hydrogenigenes]|uniref:Guanylate kinase n=2 Tax=Acetobacteroides hydrogenigenes TaxID=979970 RepID=A0A4R2EGW9_9BACT|nr:guanylate kinase [Acetobacteroides hydrogenigenes]